MRRSQVSICRREGAVLSIPLGHVLGAPAMAMVAPTHSSRTYWAFNAPFAGRVLSTWTDKSVPIIPAAAGASAAPLRLRQQVRGSSAWFRMGYASNTRRRLSGHLRAPRSLSNGQGEHRGEMRFQPSETDILSAVPSRLTAFVTLGALRQQCRHRRVPSHGGVHEDMFRRAHPAQCTRQHITVQHPSCARDSA